ncbi:uncharacterized protein LOC121877530 isoform X2 [Homarus americanus]|uniref:uncharacterized protein LOC121877530 isoform X2 n=1 Tax=Homarus americanus TaxID=6706 RepID=UPI001C452E9A|nr:uncharacterized protein LOC121877530 isoform X2 [Homarus americanus]
MVSSRKTSGVMSVRRPCGISKATVSGLQVTFLWVTYLLLGSLAIMYMEQEENIVSTTIDHHHWARFKELVAAGEVVEELQVLKSHLLDLCPHPILNHTFGLLANGTEPEEHDTTSTLSPLSTAFQRAGMGDDWQARVEEECQESLRIIAEVTETHTWTFVDAIYFTMTVVTTIGYGHICPVSRVGRRFCVLYSMVGVPLTCILLAKSSEMLSNRMLKLYTTAKKRHQRHQKALLYGITLVYLSVGFIVFMFLPSVVLSKLEDWSYEDSLYFTFITLSTIGFGDLIAGYNEDVQYQDFYKLCIVVWIMLALGYWFLLLNFLQKALKKNVPNKIKKSIRRSTRMKRQSEFFRQLVGKLRPSKFSSLSETGIAPNLVHKLKVVSQRVCTGQEKNETESDTGVVALMVEVADALDAIRPSRPKSRKPSLLPDAEAGTDNSQADLSLTLSQLLDVSVIVRSDTVPGIRRLIAQSPHKLEFTKTLFGIFDGEVFTSDETPQSENIVPSQPNEVTLPLREVLNLVTLVKSIEDEVAAAGTTSSSSSLQDDINSPTSSLPSTINSMDQRDFMPLLKDSFYKPPIKHIKLCPPIRRLSQKEEEELEETLQAFYNYTDAEESDTEGERDSQVEEEEAVNINLA